MNTNKFDTWGEFLDAIGIDADDPPISMVDKLKIGRFVFEIGQVYSHVDHPESLFEIEVIERLERELLDSVVTIKDLNSQTRKIEDIPVRNLISDYWILVKETEDSGMPF